jgi:hypothetical protein
VRESGSWVCACCVAGWLVGLRTAKCGLRTAMVREGGFVLVVGVDVDEGGGS